MVYMKKLYYVLGLLLLSACGSGAARYVPINTTTQVIENVNTNDIVEILDPCGDSANVYDEVLLKLKNGQVLASFSANSSGLNTRFSLLVFDVLYGTTDGTGCQFKIIMGHILLSSRIGKKYEEYANM